ncbi:cation/H(+) symporter 13 [Medicago truncatula]|uniref:Cation/H+ exchanger 3 n=2 Tax=Medicago truncatula TaxID=3880 RepID=G7IWX0_MEDTR|nr:cation/H(+) symporter 13 [Medicago truncatula]AES69533.1 cation/H+ exchanger 3 [Medicago truncatula]
MDAKNERIDQWTSHGIIDNEKLVCQYMTTDTHKGVFYGENPLKETKSILAFQIIVMFALSRITHFLLSPCHQTLIVAQIVAGIIVGPLFLGRDNTSFEMLFPTASIMILSTFAEFGMIIYFFKMGVQINSKQIFMVEKRAVIIGISGHLSSMVLGIIALRLVERFTPLGSEKLSMVNLAIFGSLTSFSVISSFLSEMNILNSEIGRMALSTSIVSDACMWVVYFIVINGTLALERKSYKFLLEMSMTIGYFAVLYFLLRPLVIWISNRNPKGKSMTESHFLMIIGILLIVGLSAQIAGQSSFIIAFWFGLFLPDGPPLGSILSERLGTIGSTLTVPAYCTISGLRTKVPNLVGPKIAFMEVIIIAGYIGKFVGTIIPSLYFHIEFWDSFALATIMCCKGLIDLSLYNILLNSKQIGELPFTLMVYTMVAITGLTTIAVHYIYDPSRRYKTYMRKTVKDSQKDFDLKILVCIQDEANVHPMINLLQVTNPTNTTPLSVFVLHLMELSGRAASILTKNESTKFKSRSFKENSSQHISNVFNQFLLHNQGCVTLQLFTAIAPYASMHDDICYMAMDTKSNILIVPFHKQWSMNGNIEASNGSVRLVNQKLLNKAPCSTGVLIDRSQMSGKLLVIHEKCFCEIAMLFLGGADDQEAMAYAMRIAEHPNVKLTVIWVRYMMQQKQFNIKNPYIDLMEHVRYTSNLKEKVFFKEEIVEDGAGTTQVIRRMEGRFSLVIVGRHHIANSPCIMGLTEWCELPELGPVGNLLATSDFTFSVLVVQQQPYNNEFWYCR